MKKVLFFLIHASVFSVHAQSSQGVLPESKKKLPSLLKALSAGSMQKLHTLQPQLLEKVIEEALTSKESKKLSPRFDDGSLLLLHSLPLTLLIPITYEILLLNTTCSPSYKAHLIEHVLWVRGELVSPRPEVSAEDRDALYFLWKLQGGLSSSLREGTSTLPGIPLAETTSCILLRAILDDELPNCTKTVERLLANGVPLNACDHFGRTALMYSVICGYDDITTLLVSAHADLTIKDTAPSLETEQKLIDQAKEYLWLRKEDVTALHLRHQAVHRTAHDYALLLKRTTQSLLLTATTESAQTTLHT